MLIINFMNSGKIRMSHSDGKYSIPSSGPYPSRASGFSTDTAGCLQDVSPCLHSTRMLVSETKKDMCLCLQNQA